MMVINDYLPMEFPAPPCWEMVTAVYQRELGFECRAYKTINSSIRSIAATFRLALHKSPEGLSPITDPVDLCIVLMGKPGKLGFQHCGVYWQGSVLHATPEGNFYENMSTIRDRFPLIEYWARA